LLSHLLQFKAPHGVHLLEVVSAKVPLGQLKASTQLKEVVKKNPNMHFEQISFSQFLQFETPQALHLLETESANVP
jgi:hypothetical protein